MSAPIYKDTACVIKKSTKLTWYNIYVEFSDPDILEDQEDF